MVTNDTDLANLALSKLSGIGEQNTGTGLIHNIEDTDRISTLCKFHLPVCRRNVITEFARMDCPFRETLRYADLGEEIDDADAPETAGWEYAFNLPDDCLAVVNQLYESECHCGPRKRINYEVILNKLKDGQVLLTDTLSNEDGTSAYIEYVIDLINPAAYSSSLINCIAVLLAAELCLLIIKEELKWKMHQQLLIEYNAVAVPKAKISIQSQLTTTAKTVPDFLGGRSGYLGL